ncbi:MAG: stage V sporulation protein AC [Clostridia bacterium]|nr:stage V sporulation protein AC [Clostridia bacterium]
MDMSDKEYQSLAEKYYPSSPMAKNVLIAFLVGGAICTLGEIIRQVALSKGLENQDALTITSVVLIFLSVLLTGLDVYDKIAKFAGAGTLVPITGFANAIAAPAIEFKSEGYVLGMGAKMFIIAGPVIVYGTLSAVAAGIIYYFFR